jgi:hypothetical protein
MKMTDDARANPETLEFLLVLLLSRPALLPEAQQQPAKRAEHQDAVAKPGAGTDGHVGVPAPKCSATASATVTTQRTSQTASRRSWFRARGNIAI